MAWSAIDGRDRHPDRRRASWPGACAARRCRAPISAHIMLAFVNFWRAATMGVLIGFDKVYHFLPGFVLANVFAHAHLAAIGWASMMVVGMAYRLLPMVLPAEMPKGPRLWISAILLGDRRRRPLRNASGSQPVRLGVRADVIAGFAAFLLARRLDAAPAATAAAGRAPPDPAVLARGRVVPVARRRVGARRLARRWRRPRRTRRAYRDGLWRLRPRRTFWRRWSSGWKADCCRSSRGIGRTRIRDTKARCHRRTRCPGATGRNWSSCCGCSACPSLAGGLAFDAVPFVSAGAWCLLVATVVDAANVARILRHAFGVRA